jgi:hypothetical protein
MTKYIVWDRKEQRQVGGEYSTYIKASRRCNKLDLEYGACRYNVRTVAA